VKVVTSLQTLMLLAKDVGNAKKTKDPEKIAEAERRLRSYEELCLRSDEMSTGYSYGSLYENR